MIRRSLYLFVILGLIACNDDALEQADPGQNGNFAKISYKILNETIDSLQYNHPLKLDLNNDSQVDFILTSLLVEENDLPYLYLIINRNSPHLNKILVKPTPELVTNGYWALPLNKDDEIRATTFDGSEWNMDLSKACLINVMDNGVDTVFGGEWIGKADKYLGLKFKINDQYHYGWIRVSHKAGERKLTILDYAYNKEAGKSIAAGQK